MPDYKTPLDHVDGLYANAGYVTTLDQNGNNYWTQSDDIMGPHSPFDGSNMTSYGHPRGQMHFWLSDYGFWTPVNRDGVPGIVDPNMLEIDQDYDWNHPSSTECTYDTDGCDTCKSGYNKAGFSDGTGQMIYARQHPHLEGSFAGPDYEWAPAGCERKWCGGCGTCEAQTSWGYQLGYPAWTCSQVPCDPNTNYVCTHWTATSSAATIPTAGSGKLRGSRKQPVTEGALRPARSTTKSETS